MSARTPMKLGFPTVVAASTATSSAKALTQTSVMNLILKNGGSNAVFVNSGPSTTTVVFPTSATGQNGAVILPGEIATYMKNNPADTHLATICDTGLSTTLYIQSGEGV